MPEQPPPTGQQTEGGKSHRQPERRIGCLIKGQAQNQQQHSRAHHRQRGPTAGTLCQKGSGSKVSHDGNHHQGCVEGKRQILEKVRTGKQQPDHQGRRPDLTIPQGSAQQKTRTDERRHAEEEPKRTPEAQTGGIERDDLPQQRGDRSTIPTPLADPFHRPEVIIEVHRQVQCQGQNHEHSDEQCQQSALHVAGQRHQPCGLGSGLTHGAHPRHS